MTFDERMQRVTNLLLGCAREVEHLMSDTDASLEHQYYSKLGLRLRQLALGDDPDAPPEVVRKHWFKGLLLQAGMTQKRFLELAAEDRREQTGKKGAIHPNNLKSLFDPQRGRKGLAQDWREAGKLVLSQKLGPAYDDVLNDIFFPGE